MRRIRFGPVTLFLSLFFLGALPAAAAQKVQLGLDWVIYAKHTAFFVAKDLGYFSQAGLDVDIQRGKGSADLVKRMGTGVPQFGSPDVGEVVRGRSRGIPVKMVGILLDRSVYVVFALEGSGIREPKDLAGKTMADSVFSAARRMFPALAESAGFDPKKVKWVNVTPAAKGSSLISGAVDAITAFDLIAPPVYAAARAAGKKVHTINFRDYGVDIYSNGIATTDGLIRKNPEMVRGFVGAALKGVVWGYKNPQGAMDILLKYNPTLNRNFSLETWKIMMGYFRYQEEKGPGVGLMTREKMAHTRDLISKHMGVKKTIAVEDLFTNKFVPKLSTGR
ncbi:MAG: ABC transporter substrate-binding protein [Nitrospinota bacterium]